MKTKEFHISDILSIITGRMISYKGLNGLYDILKFMTQSDDVHRLMSLIAIDSCKPIILEKYPQLKEINICGLEENPEKWVNEQIVKYGEYLLVDTIPEGSYEDKDIIKIISRLIDIYNMEKGSSD